MVPSTYRTMPRIYPGGDNVAYLWGTPTIYLLRSSLHDSITIMCGTHFGGFVRVSIILARLGRIHTLLIYMSAICKRGLYYDAK